MKRLLLLSVSAGAGHVRAAQAIEAAALARGGVEVTHLDLLTLVPAWFRKAYGEWYLDLVERHPNLWAHLYRKSDRMPAEAWEHKLRRAERGLHPQRTTAMVMTGGPGLASGAAMVERLLAVPEVPARLGERARACGRPHAARDVLSAVFGP